MYEAIGVKTVDAVLPPPAPTAPMDPSMEHINALAGKPFQAFPGLNFGTFLALIFSFSPVAGLIPVLAFLLTLVKVPKPIKETSSPFLTAFLITS